MFVLAMLLFVTAPIFAFCQEVPDVTDPSNLVVLLMPAITWIAVEIVKKVMNALGASITGGWILGLIVPGLSALAAFILTKISPDSSYVLAFVLGFASTFVDQLIKQFKSSTI